MKKLLTGFFLATLANMAWSATGLELLQDFAAKVQTADGHFSQKVVDKQGKTIDESSGNFAFSRPGKFIWNYQSPYAQKMVCDGTDIYIWDEDLNQVTVKKAEDALPTSPASILFGKADINKEWTVKTLPDKNGLQWVELTPKEADASYSKIVFGFRGKVPEVLEFTGSLGEKSTLKFNDVRTGISFKANEFKFTPPKGADVLRTS